jgi:hypothetical protein
LIGGAACALLPVLGPLLSGDAYEVPGVAVAGWSAYAVASAVLLPYSGMASVYHRQRRVLALRLLELGSLAAVVVLVTVVPGGPLWAPMALCAGPLLAAAAVRRSILVPLVAQDGGAARRAGALAPVG